ncbi:hypothetical protein PBAL39_11772 [Pedobacter sp. BAL39]|uniref:hypothetical protein n=1 Tax=Pedobacter sp. BAL39 TaxID=391596 RepID=UPI0001559BFE|nr:hypothetical protein [Pedobacter sp. BAL39]EDM36381.1 hypothetical protein PBAL39_11772 [Pedobacter sp. BAL39]
MTTIEEEIWDYIDGHGTAAQLQATADKIVTDAAYAAIYHELQSVHQQIAEIDLDTPSMSFSRNVMEQLKSEPAPVRLRTKVDKRIIYSISAFFIASIAFLLADIFGQVKGSASSFDLNLDLATQGLRQAVSPMVLKVFLFVDVLLAFAYLDTLMKRRLRNHDTKNSVN